MLIVEKLDELTKEAYAAGDYYVAAILSTVCGVIVGDDEEKFCELCVEYSKKKLAEG